MEQVLLAGLAGLQNSPLLPLILIGAMTQQQRPPQPVQPEPSQLQLAAQNAAEAYVRAVAAFESAQTTADAALRGAAHTPSGLQHGLSVPFVQASPSSSTAPFASASTSPPCPPSEEPVKKVHQKLPEEPTPEDVEAHNREQTQLRKDCEKYQRDAREEVKRSDARVTAFRKQQEEEKQPEKKPLLQPKPKKRPVQDNLVMTREQDKHEKPQLGWLELMLKSRFPMFFFLTVPF